MTELKRRDLSGIYIFDTFPGEEKRQPTCIEDCQPETRRKLLMTKSKEWMRDCIRQLAQTFKETTDYLVTEGCVTDEQRKEFFAMIDRESFYHLLSEIQKETNFTIADQITWKKRIAVPNTASPNKLTRITEPIFVFVRKSEYKTFKTNKKVVSLSKNTNQRNYENVYNFIL